MSESNGTPSKKQDIIEKKFLSIKGKCLLPVEGMKSICESTYFCSKYCDNISDQLFVLYNISKSLFNEESTLKEVFGASWIFTDSILVNKAKLSA